MTQRDDISRLRHILDAAQQALRFTQGKERQALDADDLLRLALVRLLEIIGEASRGISDELCARYPDVAWRQMAAMRNRLIHGYFEVNYDLVWETITTELPLLISQLQHVLKEEGV